MSNEITEAIQNLNREGIAAMDRIKSRMDELDGELDDLARKMEGAPDGTGDRSAPNMPGKNPLSALSASTEVKHFASDRSIRTANVPLTGSLTQIKAVVGDVAGAGNTLYDVPANRSPGLYNAPARRLSIFDVLPRLKVTSNAFEFNRLDGYANAAGVQEKEGALKEEGALPTELATAPIVTVAHWIKLSEQVLADAPALQQQVASLLTYGVLAKASAEIIAGSTAGKIQGLATQATAFASTAGATLADAVGAAATALDVAGWQADTVIMHPRDLFAIRSERNAQGYIASGWVGGAEQTVWGLRAVADPSVEQGKPLVLDSSQVAILDREQTRVEFGRSGDDMVHNLITALGEARIGLAVFSPDAVLEVALTAD